MSSNTIPPQEPLEILTQWANTPEPPAAPVISDTDAIAKSVAGIVQEREAHLFNIYQHAVTKDPIRRANAQRIAADLGLPVDDVDNNIEVARGYWKEWGERQRDWSAYPALAEHMADLEFAIVAQDSVDSLSAFERFWAGMDLGKAQIEAGQLGYKKMQAGGTLSPDDQARLDHLAGQIGKLQGESLIQGLGTTIGQQWERLPDMFRGGVLGAGVGFAWGLSGGPAAPATATTGAISGFLSGVAASSGVQSMQTEAGQSYENLVAQGYSHETARTMATRYGYFAMLPEMAGQFVPMGMIGKGAGKLAAPFMRKAVSQTAASLVRPTMTRAFLDFGMGAAAGIGTEIVTEAMQTAGEAFFEEQARQTEPQGATAADAPKSSIISRGELGPALADTVRQTFYQVALWGSFGPTLSLMSDSSRAVQARKSQDFYKAIAKGVEPLRDLAKRAPSKLESFIARTFQQSDRSTLYVDASKLVEALEQTGTTREEFRQSMPDAEAQIDTALAAGGDVTIPVEQFAVRVTQSKFDEALRPHLRGSKDEYSAAEIQQQKIEADPKKLAEEAKALLETKRAENEAFVAEVEEIREAKRQEIAATGIYNDSESRLLSSTFRDIVAVAAERSKMTPKEWLAKYPVQFVNREQAAAVQAQDATEFAQDGTRRTDTPEFKAWFGESKVVDEKGAPLVVYHGSKSPSENMAFDFSKIGTNGRSEGAGFYFTTDEKVAEGYADGSMLRVYLNIKKPMPLTQKGFPVTKLKKILRRAAEMEAEAESIDIRDGFLANYGNTYASVDREASVDSAVNEAAKLIASDDTAVSQMGGMVGGGLSAEYVNRAVVDVTGFDGIVSDGFDGAGKAGGTIYVAFLPEQIKSVNNRGTWSRESANILEQGSRGGFDPNRLLVILESPHDVSTFLHEVAHFTLQVYAEMADAPNADPKIAADMGTLLEWFGVPDLATWRGMTIDQQRPYHEQFAYGWERWWGTGEAPTERLRGVFRRFAGLLRRLYGTISGALNGIYREQFGKDLPALTPEVRGVFERMVASQEAIDLAMAERKMQAAFETQEESGMSDEDWARYRRDVDEAREEAIAALARSDVRNVEWVQRAAQRAEKDLRGDIEARRAEIAARKRQEAEAAPIFQARTMLTSGTIADDAGIQRPFKLDVDAVDAMVPDPEQRKALRKMVGEGGLSPDLVAARFGYDSGMRLVRELLGTPDLETVVAAATEAELLAEEGQPGRLLDPQERAERVSAAIRNDVRRKFIAAELKAMAKATTPRRMMIAAAKLRARAVLDQTPMGQISSRKFRNDADRSGRLSDMARAKGNLDEAIEHKRRQMLQEQMAVVAEEVAADVVKVEAVVKAAGKDDLTIGKRRTIEPVYVLRAIAAAFQLRKPIETRQQAEQIAAARTTLFKDHPQLAIIADPLMQPGAAKPWRTATYAEWQELSFALNALWDGARESQMVGAGEARAELAEVAGLFTEQIKARPPRKFSRPPDTNTGGLLTRPINYVVNAWANIKRFEHWARYMDGNAAGVFTKFVIDPIHAAVQSYRDARKKLITAYYGKLRERAKAAGSLWHERIDASSLAPGAFFHGKAELIGALLHIGNESNLAKLLVPYGWADIVPSLLEPGETVLDTRRWDAFLADMMQRGIITQDDMAFVQWVWDSYAEQLPLAQKVHRRLYGAEFKTIDPRPVVTPWGTLAGGYVPAKLDRDLAKKQDFADGLNSDDVLDIDGQRDFAFAVSTGKGFTMERKEGFRDKLQLNIARQVGSLDDHLRFIHLQQAGADALKILRHRDVLSALDEYDREAFTTIVKPWLATTVQQATSRQSTVPAVNAIAKFLRASSSVAGLGFNLLNGLVQITGISNARTEVAGTYLRSAAVKFFRHPAEAMRTIRGLSRMMDQRFDTTTRRLSQRIERMGTKVFLPGYKATKDELGAAAFWLQRTVQSAADSVTWLGAFSQFIAETDLTGMDPGQVDAEAAKHADGVVRRVQGGSNPEDLAAYEVTHPLIKLFTQFGSYSNLVLNQLISAQPGQRMRAGLWALLIPALAEATLRTIAFGGQEDEDDDGGWIDDLGVTYAVSLARNFTGMIPAAGPMVWSMAESEGTRMAVSPGITLMQSGWKGLVAAADAFGGGETTGYDAKNMASLATLILGLPLTPIGRAAGFAIDVADGKREGNMLRGMLVGR